MAPHPGNVSAHVSPISFTTPQFTLDSRRAAPTPIMAVVLVCVVETGMPVSEESSRQAAPAMSAAKPWYFFQLHHIHAHSLDDAVAADGSAQSHYGTAQYHQPQRDLEIGDVVLSVGQKDAQHENAHKLFGRPVRRA